MNSLFTELPEMDKEILYKMDGKELTEICKINKYVNSLCKSDRFITNQIATYKKMQLQFIYEPDVNPETGKKIKLDSVTYKKLVKKYGPPKRLINPETNRTITKNSRTYQFLISKGYDEHQLRSNILL